MQTELNTVPQTILGNLWRQSGFYAEGLKCDTVAALREAHLARQASLRCQTRLRRLELVAERRAKRKADRETLEAFQRRAYQTAFRLYNFMLNQRCHCPGSHDNTGECPDCGGDYAETPTVYVPNTEAGIAELQAKFESLVADYETSGRWETRRQWVAKLWETI